MCFKGMQSVLLHALMGFLSLSEFTCTQGDLTLEFYSAPLWVTLQSCGLCIILLSIA